jgi:hypothetical protein
MTTDPPLLWLELPPDHEDNATLIGAKEERHPMPLAEALRVADEGGFRVACADAADLAFRVAELAIRVSDRDGLPSLVALAAGNCLLDYRAALDLYLAATNRTERDVATWLNSGSCLVNADQLWGEMARTAGREGLAPDVVARFGPLGLGLQARAQVARGIARAHSLPFRAHNTPALLQACEKWRENSFCKLKGVEGAALCFKGGKRAEPDKKGFREWRPDQLRRWLDAQRGRMTDRRSQLLPCAYSERHGRGDVQMVNCPLWGLGSAALLCLADLQAAEYLQHVFRGSPIQNLHPQHLAALRRLVQTGLAPKAATPGDGCIFIALNFPDLPAVAFVASCADGGLHRPLVDAVRHGTDPGTWLASRLRTQSGDYLSDEEARALLVLTATGLDDQGISALAENRFEVRWAPAEVASLTRCLRSLCPEIERHLTDTAPELIAQRLGRGLDPNDLRRAAGFDEAAERAVAGSGGFVEHLYQLGGERCFLPSMARRGLGPLEWLRKQGPAPGPRERPRSGLTREDFLRTMLGVTAECVRSPVGRVRRNLTWIEARSAFLELAEDAFREAAFAVVQAGCRLDGSSSGPGRSARSLPSLAAVGQFELLVEIPEDDQVGWVADELRRCCSAAASAALAGLPVRCEAEVAQSW